MTILTLKAVSDMSHILAMGAGLATATAMGVELWGMGLAVHGAA